MATIIRIKRSSTAGNPATLAAGEMAYSSLAGGVNNGGDRLYIGTGTETNGDAANHEVIGGKYFTSMMDHAPGTLTASSAILVDSSSKINMLKVDNIQLDSSTIDTLDGNALKMGQQVNMESNKIINLGTPSAGTDAATKAYVDGITGGGSITLQGAGDTGTVNVSLADSALSVLGGTGLTSTATGTAITVNLDNTAVTAGSYGSATSVPVLTVDAQGRITAASTASVSSTLNVKSGQAGGDSSDISLIDSALTFGTGTGIDVFVSGATVTYSAELATTSNIGAASFNGNDFNVVAGAVSLSGNIGGASIPLQFLVDGGDSAVASGGAITINGGEGIDVVAPTANSIRVDAEDASTTNKGVASFATANFTVSSGAVSAKDITLGSTTLSLGGSTTTLAGLTQIDVDNVRILDNTVGSTSGTLFIDPAPLDSDAGTVIVRGDLQVQGTTTTINSTEVNIGDKNLNLADSADNNGEADGAGLTIGSSSYTGTKPAFVYDGATDRWDPNKPLDIPHASLDSAVFLNGVGLGERIEDHLANSFLQAGEGIDLNYVDGSNQLTVAAELATVSNPGVASFSSDNFTVTTGEVTITTIDGGTF
jgi:hypothetical protein|tara:strand:+ start:16 stop:1803 length:1788 start_codon:yes stop_codon:yes gene_type:complete